MARRGEIDLVTLIGSMGREQAGQRPVLVVSSDALNSLPLTVVVVPGTNAANQERDYPWIVRVPAKETGLPMETVFLCHQIRALDHKRFVDPATRRPIVAAGRMPVQRMRAFEDAVLSTLDIFE